MIARPEPEDDRIQHSLDAIEAEPTLPGSAATRIEALLLNLCVSLPFLHRARGGQLTGKGKISTALPPPMLPAARQVRRALVDVRSRPDATGSVVFCRSFGPGHRGFPLAERTRGRQIQIT